MPYQNRYIINITELRGGSVTKDLIANSAVDATKVTPGTLTTASLQNKSVTTEKLADNISVPLADGSVTSAKLATGSVTASKVAANTIETSDILDNAVTEEKIGPLAVTNTELALLSVDTGNIINDAITADKILNSNVNNDKLSSNAVSTIKIQDLNVTKGKVELGFGRIEMLAAIAEEYNVSGTADVVDFVVDHSGDVPVGAIAVIVGLSVSYNGLTVAATTTSLRGTDAPDAAPMFVGYPIGTPAGTENFTQATMLFSVPANRTTKLNVTKNGEDMRVKVQTHGYII